MKYLLIMTVKMKTNFDPEDIYIDLNKENGRTDLFDSEKWGVGSIQDQEPLTFSKMIRPLTNAALVDSALVDTALVNAASVKNDVYLWIYMIHTIKRHIVMI
jgi:hypothetical protein